MKSKRVQLQNSQHSKKAQKKKVAQITKEELSSALITKDKDCGCGNKSTGIK